MKYLIGLSLLFIFCSCDKKLACTNVELHVTNSLSFTLDDFYIDDNYIGTIKENSHENEYCIDIAHLVDNAVYFNLVANIDGIEYKSGFIFCGNSEFSATESGSYSLNIHSIDKESNLLFYTIEE